ncbi:Hsp20/alpha crystallin family protein [Pelagicoccus sp. NFK12]|uniref:Hsp20/alpha crystallin family protein n=1 Tax=Pelagicoccus enzymogenes TaxID=2773457 RepID=A0A927F9Z9_9BACT|nr:Hsp20/alpha crystallin family protein [Pelagicoccus enzymogenes]MBD5781232.1 Hsp20/alpha crystallin family protein [Pelagicoccus enzymogenes]MDQ8198866.1 Hsp20/alpha crystallin family protein [Pelagicoccus enzymogenes]
MKLVKRNSWPSDPFFEMDRLFNRAFGSSDLWPSAFKSAAHRDFPLDVHGDDDHYFVTAELPGVSKDAIDLKVENSVLSISVNVEDKSGNGESKRTMTRSITVGDDIDIEGVSAKLENGMLQVSLPKAEERRPRKIEIS